MFISIVTPCYNVSSFLEDYFDSLLNQTHTDFEVILVDDGSKDDTWEKLNIFKQRDNRIKIYQLKENTGGCKIPRETGISYAAGEWLICVDADDFLDSDYLTQLIRRQEETGADIVLSRTVSWRPNEKCPSIPDDAFDFTQILTSEEALNLCVGGWKISPAGCLVKKKLWTNCHNYLDATRRIGCDNLDELTGRELIMQASKVAFYDINYYARVNYASITRSNPKKFMTYGTDFHIYNMLKNRYGHHNKIVKKALAVYIAHIIRLVRKQEASSDVKEHLMRITLNDVLNSSFSLIRKIRTILRLFYLKKAHKPHS